MHRDGGARETPHISMAQRLHSDPNAMLQTLARLTALGPLLLMLWSPATVLGQDAPAAEMQGSSIRYDTAAQAEHASALRRARRRTRGLAAALVLSVGLMAAGTPLIVRGARDSICVLSPCPDQNRGNKLFAGGIGMVIFGFGGAIGSSFGLRAANKEKRRLERSYGE